MSLTAVLPLETIEKMVGCSIKIGPGKDSTGKTKGGPTIGKLMRIEGNKAIVVPKGHKKEEVIELSRVCVWKKGLHLGHKTSAEIADILGEEVTPAPSPSIEPVETLVSKRTPEVEGIFVIKHKDGTYYVKATHNTNEAWTIYVDEATVYETQGGGRRALSRRSNSDDKFYECEVVDAEQETQLKRPEAPKSATPAPEDAIGQMAQLCKNHQDHKDRLEDLLQARATLDAQIEEARAEVEVAAADIRAAAELMVGE